MSDGISMNSGIAARYATALFELAQESGTLDSLEKDVHRLGATLAQDKVLQDIIESPLYARTDMASAMTAIAKTLKLSTLMNNTLGVMAQKRRLFVLPALLVLLDTMITKHKGEIIADVTTAKKLTDAQSKKLITVLSKNTGKNVIIATTVDKNLIGGMIIKLGSKMIDSSIKSKLANLQNTMKEVG